MQHSVNIAFWMKKDFLSYFNTDRVVFIAVDC